MVTYSLYHPLYSTTTSSTNQHQLQLIIALVLQTFTPVVTTSSSAAGSMQKSTTFFTHLLTDENIYEEYDGSVFCTDGSLNKFINKYIQIKLIDI